MKKFLIIIAIMYVSIQVLSCAYDDAVDARNGAMHFEREYKY